MVIILNKKDFIDKKLFINLIRNLFSLFIFDLQKFYVSRLSIKLKIIDHWSRLNYILFSLLNYQIITKISKYYKKIDLINWGENQIQNKSFISVIYLISIRIKRIYHYLLFLVFLFQRYIIRIMLQQILK